MDAAPAPRRRAPLVAPGREVSSEAAPPVRRGAGRSVAAGVGTAVATAGLTYALAAGPIYVLAQIATDGLQRPAFRTALVVALVVSAVIGVACGVAAGVWYRRGGSLPTDRRSFTDGSPPSGR
jgi:hypothetical protein